MYCLQLDKTSKNADNNQGISHVLSDDVIRQFPDPIEFPN